MRNIRTEHTELKEETDQFTMFNKKIGKRREELDKKQFYKESNVEKTFSKLIHHYKERGYTIPDLSTKKNLFEPSPLLLENSKIATKWKKNLKRL